MGTSAFARVTAAAVCACFLAILAPSCGGDPGDDEGHGPTPCGNGVCEQTRCESTIRCPGDCGVCTGSCPLITGSAPGSCGQPCSSSCDCQHPGEMCSADYGFSPGTCVPVACRKCSNKQTCTFTPDDQGRCPTDATCQ